MTEPDKLAQAKVTKPISSTKLIYIFGIVAIIALVIFIYFQDNPYNTKELKQNQVNWENQNINHYQMSIYLPYSSSGYGQLPMPLNVEVNNGNVISVFDSTGKEILPNSQYNSDYYYDNFFTVPSLFSFIYDYYQEKPPSIEVNYDHDLGFPKKIYINPYREPCCQDFVIEVENFNVLR